MVYPLALTLQPSIGLLAPVLAAHAAVGLALFHSGLPLSGLTGGILLALVPVSALMAIVSERRKRALILVLHEDGGMSVQRPGEAPCTARVRPGAVAFSQVIWVQLELFETELRRRRRLNLMLVSSNVQADQWRAIKVWLRHRALRLAAVSA